MLNQVILPAARNVKDLERMMTLRHEYIVLLETRLAQLHMLVGLAQRHGKKVLLHADLVQGLKHDEYGAQFLCQVIKPEGIISTHSSVIATAKKHSLISIQRVFLLDSHSLETSFRVVGASRPDYIEVLPGVIPGVVREVAQRTQVPIIAGGFIQTEDDLRRILEWGACAISTSTEKLWRLNY